MTPRTILAQEETETDPTDPTNEPVDDGLKLWQEDDTLPPAQRESAPNAERDAIVQTISTHVILNTMMVQRYNNTGIQIAQIYLGLKDPALTNPQMDRILAAAGSSRTQIETNNYLRVLQSLEGQYDERQVNELVARVTSYVNSQTDTVVAQYSQSVQGVVNRLTAAQPNYVGMRPQFSPNPTQGPVASRGYNRRRVIMAQAPAPAPALVPESPDAVMEPVWDDQQGDPLSYEPFKSVEQLKAHLLQFHGEEGRAELYNKVFDLVGPENEDRAKEALAKFFQGLAGGLFDLYRILQEQGLASPIDEEMVGQIMQTNPEMAQNEEGVKQEKVQGLFLPPADSGLFTTAEADEKMAKQASGSVGGSGNGYNAYVMEGTSRMCPKIRNVVNTFICRYHCLDGLAIDDAQVLCGEALWRQAVMDKYSREYKDADGNWVGGYINKRFEVHHDTGGHPYQLKPGQRHAPIHEDAWSQEKRLQEMRRTESKDRGYCETPGDPKGLYNFDQHDIAKGPTPPDLSGKDRDKLAKNAGNLGDITTAQVGSPEVQDLARQDPREFGDDSHREAAQGLLDNHIQTGEPLDEDEVRTIISAGLASEPEFEMTGGGLYQYTPAGQDTFEEDYEPRPRPGLADQWYEEDRGIHPVASGNGFNLREAKKKGKKKDWNPNPWAVCHTTVDKDKNSDKFEDCVQDIKKKQASNSGTRGTKVAAMDVEDPHDSPEEEMHAVQMDHDYDILHHHQRTEDPLSEAEVRHLVKRRVANMADFEPVGNDMYRYIGEDRSYLESRQDNYPGPRPPLGQLRSWDRDDPGADAYASKKTAGKAFNLSKMATNGGDPMMDHVDHGPRQKQCKQCRKMTALDAKVCDGMIADPMGGPARPCGGADFHILHEGDVKAMTGGIESPDLAINASVDAEITCANGVFRAASVDGRKAYGSSPAEAARKLSLAMTKTAQRVAQDDVQHMELPPMQEMSEEILNKMKEEGGEIAPPAAPQEAAPAPAGNAEQWAIPEGLPPVGELPIEGEEPQDDEDHVSANDLDVYLEDEADDADADEQAETDVEADALGLGPDPKTR